MTDEGDLNEEIEIAQDLIEMGKKHQMSRQLRMWLYFDFEIMILLIVQETSVVILTYKKCK